MKLQQVAANCVHISALPLIGQKKRHPRETLASIYGDSLETLKRTYVKPPNWRNAVDNVLGQPVNHGDWIRENGNLYLIPRTRIARNAKSVAITAPKPPMRRDSYQSAHSTPQEGNHRHDSCPNARLHRPRPNTHLQSGPNEITTNANQAHRRHLPNQLLQR